MEQNKHACISCKHGVPTERCSEYSSSVVVTKWKCDAITRWDAVYGNVRTDCHDNNPDGTCPKWEKYNWFNKAMIFGGVLLIFLGVLIYMMEVG